MGLLARLRGKAPEGHRPRSLAGDARAMRAALDGIHSDLVRVNGPSAPVDLRAIVRDLLEGEVKAPTTDVAELVRTGEDPGEFYDREVAPGWEGLSEAQRAERLEGNIELSTMMDAPGAAAGLPPEMLPRVHTKTLLLAWAFDETYGYLSSLARGGAAA
jgi:hypothetical protein